MLHRVVMKLHDMATGIADGKGYRAVMAAAAFAGMGAGHKGIEAFQPMHQPHLGKML